MREKDPLAMAGLRMSCPGSQRSPRRASTRAEVWLYSVNVGRRRPTVSGKVADEITLQQVPQNGVGVAKHALERIEEPRRLGYSPLGEQPDDMGAE